MSTLIADQAGKIFNSLGQQTTTQSNTGVLRGGPLVAGVEVSVKVSESHTLSAEVTEQALESGAIVSDHVIVKPETVAVTFSMTNSGDGVDVAREVFETFKKILEDRQPVELITEHFIYSNMILFSLTPLHAAPYKGALQCTATLKRINQLEIETVGRSAEILAAGSTSKTGSAEVVAGNQKGEPVKQSFFDKIAGDLL